ncbi:MAG: NAD(P)/FAD-dependent oxidoreductase [Chloroflexota bacterium]
MAIPKRVSSMPRTPLLSAVRRSLRLALYARQPHSPPVDELVDMQHTTSTSRRRFLRNSVTTLVSLGSAGLLNVPQAPVINAMQPLERSRRLAPRIAIVGAGIAGLNAAYTLQQAGYYADIYEASQRTGGRIFSIQDRLGPGLTTELGGEFIDSNHTEMLSLAQEFGLELADFQGPSEADLIPETYFFGGQHYTEQQVVEAFLPLAPQIERDYEAAIQAFDEGDGPVELDHLSIAAYLDRIGASGWVRELLEVAYTTEYGLPIDQQSSLNLIFLIGTDVADGTFEIFGESDERYTIKGGNQRITDALAHRMKGQIHFAHRLEAIRRRGDAYRLTFAGPNGSAVDVVADFVIVCIPFTVLRSVELRLALPRFKRRVIHQLNYGTNAKLILGFSERVWRQQGYSGTFFTDEPFQNGWDSSRQQAGEQGSLTLYLGGQPGLDVGDGRKQRQAQRFLPGIDQIFPGATEAYNGIVQRFHWPSAPLYQGSYACYTVGQWTTIAGSEITPVDNLFFAGEHCSEDFQGYMNGGAETGRSVAKQLLAKLDDNRLHAVQRKRLSDLS